MIGLDIGGTFTDLALLEPAGTLYLCPGRAALLNADVVLEGAPPVRAVIARLPEG